MNLANVGLSQLTIRKDVQSILFKTHLSTTKRCYVMTACYFVLTPDDTGMLDLGSTPYRYIPLCRNLPRQYTNNCLIVRLYKRFRIDLHSMKQAIGQLLVVLNNISSTWLTAT